MAISGGAVGSDADRDRALLSKVLVSLYRGVLYREGNEGSLKLWSGMLEMQARVMDHFSAIGLQLVIDEGAGFAYLRYPPATEELAGDDAETPRLIARRQLTFQVSLLLALLRKRLAEFEAGGEGTRLVMTRDEIVSMVSLFMPEGGNEARIMDRIDAGINKVKEMGFVRSLRNQPHVYEVLGIIKAFVDAEWLGEFDRRLDDYRNYILSGALTRSGGEDEE